MTGITQSSLFTNTLKAVKLWCEDRAKYILTLGQQSDTIQEGQVRCAPRMYEQFAQDWDDTALSLNYFVEMSEKLTEEHDTKALLSSVTFLLQDASLTDENGNTLLHSHDFFDKLHERLNIDDKDLGDKAYQYLLILGLDPNQKNKFKATPLHSAISHYETTKSLCRIKILLQTRGINPNLANENDRYPTILHWFFQSSIQEDELALLELILKAGAQVNQPVKARWTPLEVAFERKNEAMMELLIKYKALVNQPPFHIGTPLVSRALEQGNIKLIQAALDQGLDINAPHYYHNETWLPLSEAIHHKQIVAVEFLLEKGANPRAITQGATSPLDYINSLAKQTNDPTVQKISQLIHANIREHNPVINPPVKEQKATTSCFSLLFNRGKKQKEVVPVAQSATSLKV